MSTTKTKSRLKTVTKVVQSAHRGPAPVAHRAAAAAAHQAPNVLVSKTAKLPPISFSLGSDPEIMLVDTQDGNKIVSALRVLDGHDKHDPIDLGDGIRMYGDSTLVEVAFPPVLATSGRIVNHMRDVFTRMQKHLGDRYKLLPQAAHYYHPSELEDKRTREIGCVPHRCAYTGKESLPGEFTDTCRSSSMHLHLGRADYKNPSDQRLLSRESKIEAVKMMDTFVGAAGVMITQDATAVARRMRYGSCGCFRETAYGLEWRVLESYALNTPELTQLIWDLTDHAMTHIQNGTAGIVIQSCEEGEVRSAIDRCDKTLAAKVLKQAQLPEALMARVNRHYETPGMARAWGLV